MIKINLVPREILAKAQQKQRAIQIGAALALAALIILLVSLGFVARLHRLEKKLALDKAELKRLEAVVAKVKELESMAAQLRARLQVIDDLDRGRRAYPVLMNDFVRSVPPGVRVKSLTTVGGGGSPFKLAIAAEARSNEDIRSWMLRMEESGRFSGIELGAVSAMESPIEVLRNFTLTATHTPQL
jgi:Tfp pilus assembly protein PilN